MIILFKIMNSTSFILQRINVIFPVLVLEAGNGYDEDFNNFRFHTTRIFYVWCVPRHMMIVADTELLYVG